METIAVLNATNVNAYALAPFARGPSSFERVLGLASGMVGKDKVLVLGGAQELPLSGCRVARRDAWTMKAVLEEADAFARANPLAKAVLYLHADAPFTDAALAETVLGLHARYRAEYTFADGYPPGFAPEALSTKALPNLVALAAAHDAPADREGLFAVIQKDINSYDIETHLSPVDLRGYRFSPLCDTKRDVVAAERLWALGCRSAADASRLLPSHPELLRTLPAFLWVQVADACPQACSYCPYPLMGKDPRKGGAFMPADRFARLMDEAEALCDDLVVDLSLWGEPSLHPDFAALADAVLSHPRFTLLVETSGIGWKEGVAEAVAGRAGGRVHWIVSLDESDEAAYRALRGDGFDEAAAFARRMAALAPGQVHAQAVRMKDNEERLEGFYRGWKKTLDKVIIQKYDSFAGSLPDRMVAELSPLDRGPCRHLARDMAVLLDGSVPLCKHCLAPMDGSGVLGYASVLGNAFDSGLAALWDAAGPEYENHCVRNYPSFCGRCDEYHTFNA